MATKSNTERVIRKIKLEEKEKYIKWIRHPEHFRYEDIFHKEFKPEKDYPYLYRGLKQENFLVAEIIQNKGYPTRGPIWLTTDKKYALSFASGFLLEIDPLLLARKFPGSFIKDKYENYTTGLPVNIYACLSLPCRRKLTSYFQENPFLSSFNRHLAELLNN